MFGKSMMKNACLPRINLLLQFGGEILSGTLWKAALKIWLLCFLLGVYKKMRGEEARLSDNNQDMEKVKQQHYIQEDKVGFFLSSFYMLWLFIYY